MCGFWTTELLCMHTDTLDLYFQLCSIEANTDTLAVMAATLANGGVSPLSEERVVCNRAVRDTLSLMYSCGMYDYSGQFAFTVGLPAKSGVSGDMIIVVPNVMGIAIYSPLLDSLGNTVRGVKFAEQLVEKFNFHNYDSLVYSETHKIDPRKRIREARNESISNMMYAARDADISAIQRYILLGVSIHERDYDERTVLHIAAAEGNDFVLKFLLERWKETADPEDRYGRTPLDEAKEFGHTKCVELLEKMLERQAQVSTENPARKSRSSAADAHISLVAPQSGTSSTAPDDISSDATTTVPIRKKSLSSG
ncbi:Putative glutaminase 3 [Toxocara canis]|uniref:glutaminase n=1 Tax=Toxocara canis TaxID=6265 RepID=A0A0B2V132_TOXCA|nr:Putative glutaminase 3 [Toxocara canis]